MKLKGLFFLLTLLIFNCAREDQKNIPLSAYVGANALAAIQINGLSSLHDSLEVNDFIKRFENLGPYKSIVDKIAFLEQIDAKSTGMLVFSETEKDSIEFFFVSEHLSDMFSVDSLRAKYAEKLIFGNRTIHKYTMNDKAVFSTLADDMLFVSSSASFLNETLEDVEDRRPNITFQRLYGIADKKKPLNIFFNLEQSDLLMDQIVSDVPRISVSDFADWIYFDVDIGSELLGLNGIAIANDSLPNYLNLFKGTEALRNTTPFIAPLESDGISSYTFDDHTVFETNRSNYLNKPAKDNIIFNTVEEIGIVYLNTEKVVLLKTYGSEELLRYLGAIQNDIVDYQGNGIQELNEGDFLFTAFEPLVDDFNAKFCTVLDDVFVFGRTKEVLQTIISSYKKGSTFDKNPVYTEASKNLGGAANILVVSNPDKIEQLSKDNFIDNLHKDLKDPKLDGYAYGAQVVTGGDFYHVNLSAQRIVAPSNIKTIRPIFNVALDTTLANEPQFVMNHNTKRKEVVVQDVTNKLYLISSSGKILWKKQLEGKIQGKIHQVDIYKNGRLQLAFTTNNQFLILDRNGKEVRPFTLKYEGGNLNPLAVFDYEGKKDYRFVVTQGEKVFMYNRKAQIVTGFKYTRAEAPIISAPKHIVIGNKDHLVFQMEGGILKILNRVGDVRVRVSDKIDFSENGTFLYKNKFTVTDKKGILHQINSRGNFERTNLGLNPDHGLDATLNTLVYMNDNILNIKGKKVELDLGVYSRPKIFYIYDKIYVSVTDIQNQKVYLFDSQANLIPNFPIFGISAIDLTDIDNDRRLEVVVKNQTNSLTIYTMD
ncbi:ribonuclease HII [Maribacter algicola]|uniref:Ribonuclease HII n=1 Tax=Meishania litoralis TaxID=3434685 RepID=A0ACC7LK58_9FLAO